MGRSGRAEGAPRQRQGSAAERHGRIPKGFVLQALAAHQSSWNFMKSQRSFMEFDEISTRSHVASMIFDEISPRFIEVACDFIDFSLDSRQLRWILTEFPQICTPFQGGS